MRRKQKQNNTVMKKVLLIIITFIVLLSNASFGQKNNTFNEKEFEKFVSEQMDKWSVPGLAISIVQNGEIIYKNGFGVKDIETKNPITTQTLFGIASCTKAFTSTLAAQLEGEGNLSWNKPVKSYIPTFKLFDDYTTNHTNLIDLLTHRTGITRCDIMRDNADYDRQELLKRLQYLKPGCDFRTKLQYTNIGYMVAGALMESITNSSWEDLIKERIFSKLEMHSTNTNLLEAVKNNEDIATPYIIYDRKEGLKKLDYHYEPLLGPAGNINSNINDLSKWLLFNINNGKHKENAIISPSVLSRVYNPTMPIPSRNETKERLFDTYALGWLVSSYRGHKQIQHGGVLFGYTALVSFLPNDNTGVVIVSNLNGIPHVTSIIERYVYDKLLGMRPVNWSDRYVEQFKRMEDAYNTSLETREEVKSEGVLVRDISEYTGVYDHPAFGEIEVVLQDDEMKVILKTLNCPLKHLHHDAFIMTHPVSRQEFNLVFQENMEGNIDGFKAAFERGVDDIEFDKINK